MSAPKKEDKMPNVRLYTVEKGAVITDLENLTLYAHLRGNQTYKNGGFTDFLQFRLSPKVSRDFASMTQEDVNRITAERGRLFSPGDRVYLIVHEEGHIDLLERGTPSVVISAGTEVAYDLYEKAAAEYRSRAADYGERAKPIRSRFDARLEALRSEQDKAEKEVKAKFTQEEVRPVMSEGCFAALYRLSIRYKPRFNALEEEIDAAVRAELGERPFLENMLAALL